MINLVIVLLIKPERYCLLMMEPLIQSDFVFIVVLNLCENLREHFVNFELCFKISYFVYLVFDKLPRFLPQYEYSVLFIKQAKDKSLSKVAVTLEIFYFAVFFFMCFLFWHGKATFILVLHAFPFCVLHLHLWFLLLCVAFSPHFVSVNLGYTIFVG